MAGKTKCFIMGFLTHLIFSGNKKEIPQEVRLKKEKEYETSFSDHPFIMLFSLLFAIGFVLYYLILVLK